MGKREEIKKEDVIQAVVMADSFNNSFEPMTKSTPSCLLPLAGRPLIEYSLQCLAYSGVQDVILYLTNNSAKVKEWLKTSVWREGNAAAPFPVTCIVNEDCRSFGDGMRDLYEKGVLRQDFILISGDLVSNIDIKPFLSVHKENFTKDKHSIMTAVYSKSYQGNPLRCKGSELIMATEKSTSQIIFYQRSQTKATNFPIEIFQHDEIEVMFDLMDPNIYICSPTLLALFSDNFDIQDMDTMMNEILESELVDSTIYSAYTKSGFGSRVQNPYLYNQVLDKVLSRWVYPIVPERNMLNSTGSTVSLQNNCVYRSKSAVVKKGAELGRGTFIGDKVVIEPGCAIVQSAVEAGSSLGQGAKINGSIVMKNCKIGEGAVLNNCIVGEGAEIPANCVINEKTLLGPGVLLKPGVNVPAQIRISFDKSCDGFSDDEEGGEGDEGGEEGEYGPKAYLYEEEEDEDEDFEDLEEKADLWGSVFEFDPDEDDDYDSDADSVSSGGNQMDDNDESDDDGGIDEHDDVKNFRREVKDSLIRGNEEGINTDNLVLEINGSKHAWNTTLSEVNQCVLESVLTLHVDTSLPPAKLLQAVKGNIVKFKALLLKYSKSKSGQDYYLAMLPDLVQRNPGFMDILAKVLHILYELDILGETSILTWAGKLQDGELKKKIGPFLEWLEDEDEDSSEEDDDEDDE